MGCGLSYGECLHGALIELERILEQIYWNQYGISRCLAYACSGISHTLRNETKRSSWTNHIIGYLQLIPREFGESLVNQQRCQGIWQAVDIFVVLVRQIFGEWHRLLNEIALAHFSRRHATKRIQGVTCRQRTLFRRNPGVVARHLPGRKLRRAVSNV